MSTRDVLEQEFMSLAPGVGLIPDKFRNRGYSKLDFGPGEGGITPPPDTSAGGGDVRSLLAALASGADPQQYAKELLGAQEQPRGRRAAR